MSDTPQSNPSTAGSWMHLLGSITTVDRQGILHAAPDGEQFNLMPGTKRRKGKPPLRTLPTVCGKKHTRPVGVGLVNADGEKIGQLTMLWPPFAESEAGARCRECWLGTGKPRPSDSWRPDKPGGLTKVYADVAR